MLKGYSLTKSFEEIFIKGALLHQNTTGRRLLIETYIALRSLVKTLNKNLEH